MTYFDGLNFISHAYHASLQTWIERRFDHFALNFCRSGAIWWSMNDDKPRRLTGPVAWWTVGTHIVNPPPLYIYGAYPGEHWEHFYVTFSGPRAIEMAQSGLIESSLDVPHFRAISDGEDFTQKFFALFETLGFDGPRSVRGVHLLEGLFLELKLQEPLRRVLTPMEIEVREWLNAIRAAPGLDWDIESQARQMAVSSGHLRRVATQIAGVSPHRFVLERRLDLAAERLRNSSTPIKLLAAECGFHDMPHFSRLFVRRYGLPPATYRRETQLLTTDDSLVVERHGVTRARI